MIQFVDVLYWPSELQHYIPYLLAEGLMSSGSDAGEAQLAALLAAKHHLDDAQEHLRKAIRGKGGGQNEIMTEIALLQEEIDVIEKDRYGRPLVSASSRATEDVIASTVRLLTSLRSMTQIPDQELARRMGITTEQLSNCDRDGYLGPAHAQAMLNALSRGLT